MEYAKRYDFSAFKFDYFISVVGFSPITIVHKIMFINPKFSKNAPDAPFIKAYWQDSARGLCAGQKWGLGKHRFNGSCENSHTKTRTRYAVNH